MKSIIRLHPLLEDAELRAAYLSCEEALKVKRTGKCLMRNSGVTVEEVQEAFRDVPEICRADVQFYYDTAFDWSENGNMRINWISTIKNIARNDLKAGKLKLCKHKPIGGSNLGGKPKPDPVSKTAMTYAEFKKQQKEKTGVDLVKISKLNIGNP
jgi:hypothetical protein